MTVLSQNNLGLLKKEKITTYWDKEEKIIRSSGYYKVDGVTSVGAKTGKWKYYYRNGIIKEECNYFEGKKNGNYRQLYPSGKIKIKAYFTIDKIDSTYKAFYENGKIAETGNYKLIPKLAKNDTFSLKAAIKVIDQFQSFKSGEWKYYYPNGQLMEIDEFKEKDTTEYLQYYYDSSGIEMINNGKGERQKFYNTGKTKSITQYNDGEPNGIYKHFKPNGELRRSGYYSNGLMDSTWKEWFLTSKALYQITHYKSGEKHGAFKELSNDGRIVLLGNYLNDQKNGLWEYYFNNDQLDMKGKFQNDLQHGYWEFYYPNGQMYYEGNFKEGKKIGDWEFYYNNGQTWRTGKYLNDQKNGFWSTLYENGGKSMEGHFKNDLEDGSWSSWYENEQIKDKGSFNAGKMHFHWDGYYKNGQIKYSGDYDKDLKNNKWTYWSENGRIIEIRNYSIIERKSALIPGENRIIRKSINNGKWTKYSDLDATIISEENYSNGDLNGTSKYYYPGGVINSRVVNYKDGLLDGMYQSFNRKGNLVSETNYKGNKKHGYMKIYNKRGKIISHLIYKDGVKIKDVIKKVTYKYPAIKDKK